MSNASRKNQSGHSEKFNVFIIPMMVILGIIPLIIHLKFYDTHLEDQAFFYSETYGDVFLYYKSLLFIIVCGTMLVLTIVRAMIRQESLKFSKVFIPLAVYAALSLLSAICSRYGSFSFTGIFEQFESIWVLLGYAMTVYYCYLFIASAKDVNILMNVLMIGTAIMLLIGMSQAFSHDIFRTELGRRLILPMEYWADEGMQIQFQFPLGRVYLTLYNPDYVGSYVVLISPVFLMLAFAKKKIRYAVLSIAIYIGLLFCILCSGSRAGFVGVAASFILLMIVFNKKLIRFIHEGLILIALIVAVIYTYNNYTHNQLVSKVKQALDIDKIEYTLKKIETNDENVVIHYNNHQLKLSYNINEADENVGVNIFDEHDNAVAFDITEDAEGGYGFTITDERFSGINFRFAFIDGYPKFQTKIDNISWNFVYSDTDQTYYYVTNKGKFVKIHDADYIESLNDLGKSFSGRAFIWSRTLPLLKDNIFLGTGPDTFLLAFPNDDFVALSNSGYGDELITKPHNMYLQTAVQTGVLSLICFLVFYIWYFYSSLKLYLKADKSKYLPLVGIGILCGTFGYMVVGMLNDSMVVISPLYWTLIGIGLAINFMIKRDNIFPGVDEVK